VCQLDVARAARDVIRQELEPQVFRLAACIQPLSWLYKVFKGLVTISLLG